MSLLYTTKSRQISPDAAGVTWNSCCGGLCKTDKVRHIDQVVAQWGSSRGVQMPPKQLVGNRQSADPPPCLLTVSLSRVESLELFWKPSSAIIVTPAVGLFVPSGSHPFYDLHDPQETLGYPHW